MNDRALMQTGPHRLIRASAGAGKTYQLATRYLSLLRLGAEPGHILATTFTRKAAGEIFGRILNRLARAIDMPDELDRLERDLDHEPLWQAAPTSQSRPRLTRDECIDMLDRLVHALHRINVSTLDSFFHRITRTFALELDVPMDAALLDDRSPQAADLRLRAIEALLGEAAGSAHEPDELAAFIALLRQVHHDQLKRSVTQSIDDLVAGLYDVYRDTADAALWSSLEAPGLLNDDALRDAIDALEAMADAVPTNNSGKADQRWGKAFGNDLKQARFGDWDGFIAGGIAGKLAAGESKYYIEMPDDWAAAYQPLIDHARAVQIERLKRQTESTFELLRRFDAHFTALRTQQGMLLFSDLAHKLARELPALGPDVMSDVYFRLDGRVNHLLIDEFQDTSLNQWQVLQPMIEEVTAPDASERSAFIVGDTKQSIYGWRGGCAELFDDVQAQLTDRGLRTEALNVSYRSSPIVLDAVNQVFDSLAANPALTEDAATAQRWQAQFETHGSADHVKDLPGHVLLRSTPAPDDNDTEPDDASENDDSDEPAPASTHERFVAERIAALRTAAPDRSIGVLVRRRRAAATLLHELRRLGIDASGEGGHPVTDIPAVTAVLAALTLADHPGDEVSTFHVANSPVGEMLDLHDPSDKRAARAVSMRIRQRLLADGYAETLSEWVAQLAPSCHARGLARLTQLIELAERYETDAAQPLRPARFVDYAGAMHVEEPSPAEVRVMTIHASKGLEFDAVVLPELDAPLSNRTELLVQRETPTGAVEAVYRNPDKTIRALIPRVQQAYDAYRDQQRFEDLCTLYVAMTRARQALHLYVKPRRKNRNGNLGKLPLTLASVVREALRDPSRDESAEGDELLYERGHAAWFGESAATTASESAEAPLLQLSLAKAGDQPRRSWLSVSPSSMEASGRVRGPDLLDLGGAAARQRGTLMHAWFEMVGFVDQGDGVPSDDALLEAARQRLPEMDRAQVQSELTAFRAMLAQPGVWDALCSHGADTLWAEHDFVVRQSGRLMRGTFDRVAIQYEGGAPAAATLIDFKTDRVPDDQTREASMQRYAPQIAAYRGALASLLEIDEDRITARLVFLESGEVIDVPTDES